MGIYAFSGIESGRAVAGEPLTEDVLREKARALGWYVREGTSVPRLDGGWRHPFTVTADSRDLCELVNSLALRTPSSPQEAGRTVAAQPVPGETDAQRDVRILNNFNAALIRGETGLDEGCWDQLSDAIKNGIEAIHEREGVPGGAF